MNNQFNILFLCARSVDAVSKPLHKSDLNGIDWQELLVIARQQGMAALLYGHLHKLALLEELPESAKQALHRFFVLNVARNEGLERLLFEVLSIIKSLQIDVIPVKGLVLVKELYGDTAWRTMEDLDFLVPPEDILAVRKKLLTSGFTDNINLRLADLKEYVKAGWDFSFTHIESKLIIEIGSGMSPRYMGFNVFGPELFAHQQEVILSGTPVKTLSPESQLLLLCIHGTKHHWNRIIWLSDLGALVHYHPELDFVLVEKLAREMGIWRMVIVSLRLISLLLDISLPPIIEKVLIHDYHTEKLASWLALRISENDTLTSWQYRRFYLMTLDRSRDRLRYLIDLTFSPTLNDWKVIKLPYYLRPLYYVIRPFRMCYSWCSRVFTSQ